MDWEKFIAQFKNIEQENLYADMEQLLLQTKAGALDKNIINENTKSSTQEEYIQSLAVAFMSTPEYQLC